MKILHRPVKRLLERLPLRLTQLKPPPIGKRLICCRNSGIQQKLADALMTGTCGILQKLLDRYIGANINPLGF
jgi:hypothetical protein